MNWKEKIIGGIRACAFAYPSKASRDMIPGLVQSYRDDQLVGEKEYFLTVTCHDLRVCEAVQLIGYYNMLGAFEAAVRGELNGKTATQFLESAWRAYRYMGDVQMSDILDLCVETLFPPCKHVWAFEGKRPCRRSENGIRIDTKTGQECSENVYRCSICGELDYGEPGGPAHAECQKCPFDWSDR